MNREKIITASLCIAMGMAVAGFGASYHVDSKAGDDGLSPQTAWKTLKKASDAALAPGDRLLLRRNGVFEGQLALTVQGSAENPIVVDAYGHDSASLPVIDAKGLLAGVRLTSCSYLEVNNLEIAADRGTVQEEAARTRRYGVFATTASKGGLPHIHLKGLYIHDIFVSKQLGGLQDKGIPIDRLPNDSVGLRMGLMVDVDFFGNPINGQPDMGAIEVQE